MRSAHRLGPGSPAAAVAFAFAILLAVEMPAEAKKPKAPARPAPAAAAPTPIPTPTPAPRPVPIAEPTPAPIPVVTSRPAAAPDPVPAEADPEVPSGPAGEPPAVMSHRHQVGLAFMPGVGYRVIAPYKEHVPCEVKHDTDDRRVCSGRSPVFLDLQASFGITDSLDVISDLRFGLEKETFSGSRQFAFAPGLRFWVDTDAQLKLYSTVQFAFDNTRQANPADAPNKDFGVRNANGLMYDHTKNFGVFLQFGETMGFVRWFSLTVDVAGGVQARFP